MDELTELASEKRRAYKRDWARKNPEKCNQYVKKYWLKKAMEELKARKAGENPAAPPTSTFNPKEGV